jgi:polyhydroxyalkanoate synthase
MSEGKTENRGTDVQPEMAPFDVWAEWMRANMGPMTATPGASVPWLMMPGIRTGEEAAELPEGAVRSDPLLSTVEKLWDANPMQNVLPIDWVEITRALQTLWVRPRAGHGAGH